MGEMKANRQDMNEMKTDAKRMGNKMDMSVQNLKKEIKGEKQSMGLNPQAGLEEVKGKMADWKMMPARGETTESGGSATVVRTAM